MRVSKKEVKSAAAALLKFYGKTNKKWCQKAFAVTKTGRPISPTSRHAVKWCLDGACKKLGLQNGNKLEIAMLRMFKGTHNIWELNDHNSFADIHKALTKLAK